uniref:Cytochrome P450 n=1 Tax=Kalanchoe fedtschenkoi TaxID=63787 RepID=A0A7N0UDC6_KALFE
MFQLSQKYGPAMLLKLGTLPTVVVSNAEMAREVLQTHDADFCSRPVHSPGPEKLSYGFLGITFGPHSHYNSRVRKLFTYELLKGREQFLWAARVDEMSKMVKSLADVATTPVNLNDHIFKTAEGILGQAAFGKSYGAKQFKDKKLQTVLDECMDIASSFNAEDFYPNWAGRLIDYLTGYRARLERNFNDLDVGKNRESSKLSMNNVKALLLVGNGAELLMHPEKLKEAKADVRSVVGKKALVEEPDMEHLKYIKCIVKEIFRLHPPAPLFIAHESINSTKIGKEVYDVLAKTRILVNAWAVGRDPAHWSDPHKFCPERSCPGMMMGSTSVTYILANLLHCCDWEFPEGVRREDVCMEEEGGITMHKKTPLIVVPKRVN